MRREGRLYRECMNEVYGPDWRDELRKIAEILELVGDEDGHEGEGAPGGLLGGRPGGASAAPAEGAIVPAPPPGLASDQPLALR